VLLTLESEDTPKGFTLILTFPRGDTLKRFVDIAAFWAAGFDALSSSSTLPVAYRKYHLTVTTFTYIKLFSFKSTSNSELTHLIYNSQAGDS
jgi:hypothetical protein